MIDLLRSYTSGFLFHPLCWLNSSIHLRRNPSRTGRLNTPAWVEVVNPKSSLIPGQLDPGESEAIALAVEVDADILLIDEQTGRQEAVRRGLKVAGTLSVLDESKPGSSASTTLSLSFERPHSVFHRLC